MVHGRAGQRMAGVSPRNRVCACGQLGGGGGGAMASSAREGGGDGRQQAPETGPKMTNRDSTGGCEGHKGKGANSR
jgi:hypothetical protein